MLFSGRLFTLGYSGGAIKRGTAVGGRPTTDSFQEASDFSVSHKTDVISKGGQQPAPDTKLRRHGAGADRIRIWEAFYSTEGGNKKNPEELKHVGKLGRTPPAQKKKVTGAREGV